MRLNNLLSLFENKMESILKSPTDGGKIKRNEIDQERLRYLGTYLFLMPLLLILLIDCLEKKCQSLVQDFENLDTKTQGRLNEVISSLNKKITKKDLENQEFEMLDKFDEFKEEVSGLLDNKVPFLLLN